MLYHALAPPDNCRPNTSDKITHPTSVPQTRTISSLDHVLPPKNMEDILDIELGTRTSLVIKMLEYFIPFQMVHDMNNILNVKLGTSNTAAVHMMDHTHHQEICDPFLHHSITTTGCININNIIEMQCTILNSYPNTFFSIVYQTAVFHQDC